MEQCENKGAGHKKVCWGTIIAGAAIVAGVILFAPGVAGSLSGAIEHIGSTIANLFSGGSTGIGTMLTELGKNIVTALSGETAKKVAGATLIASGAAYFMSDKHKGEEHYQMSNESAKSYRAQLDTELMQKKMVIQAAAAGNPQAMAMMQGTGR